MPRANEEIKPFTVNIKMVSRGWYKIESAAKTLKWMIMCEKAGIRRDAATRSFLGTIEQVVVAIQIFKEGGHTVVFDKEVRNAIQEREQTLRRAAYLAANLAEQKLGDLPNWLPKSGMVRPFQARDMLRIMQSRNVIVGHSPGLGKAQPVDEPVLTPDGWRKMGELKVGDLVYDKHGNPTTITGVYPQGVKPVVKVHFNDRTWTRCCEDHLWEVKGHHSKGWVVHPTHHVRRKLRRSDGHANWNVPVTQPIENNSITELPLNPYLLGLLLGNAAMGRSTIEFSSAEPQLVASVQERLPMGVTLKQSSPIGGRPWDYHISKPEGRQSAGPNELTNILRELDLGGKKAAGKFIPSLYKFHTIETRLSVLQGLMDTDGSACEDGGVDYVSASETLVSDVEELVQMLGGVARRQKTKIVNGVIYYRTYFKMRADMCPFRLERKASCWKSPTKYPPARKIVAIASDGEAECQCISVASPTATYLTRSCIVTHNTRCALLAARAAKELEAQILVVGPPQAWSAWYGESRKVWPELTCSKVIKGGALRWPEKGELMFVTYGMMLPTAQESRRKGAGAPKYNPIETLANKCPQGMFLIADEAHALKGCSSLQSLRFRAMARIVKLRHGSVWPVTGSPLIKDPLALWNLFQAMDAHIEAWGSWPRFVDLFNGRNGYWGGYEWPKPPQPQAIEILSKYLIRREIEDVLPELPAKQRTFVELEVDELDKASGKALEKLRGRLDAAHVTPQKLVEAGIEGVQLPQGTRKELMEEISRVRKELATAKIPTMKRMVESYEDAGEPLVVFSAHRAPIEALKGRKGWGVILGDTSASERQRIEADFQAGKLIGLGATIKAGGTAITLTRANHALFVDLDWEPEWNRQAEDRIRRIGQHKACFYTFLIVNHIIELHAAKILIEKLDRVEGIIGAVSAKQKTQYRGDKF